MKAIFTTLCLLVISVSFSQNVGIGTTTPNYKLHVRGDVFVQSNLGSFILGYDGGNQWQMSTINGGADIRWLSSPDGGTTKNYRHYFSQNGNVGIGGFSGVNTPHAQLDVLGNGTSAATNNLLLRNSNGDTLVKVRDDGTMQVGNPSVTDVFNYKFRVESGDKGSLFIENPIVSANATVRILRGVSEASALYTTALDVEACCDYASRMTGYGGIYAVSNNTLRPGAHFEAFGTGRALETYGKIAMINNGEAANNVLTSDALGNATWQPLPSSASTWAVSGNNIYNSNTANVGIGTPAPNYKLHVAGDLFVQSNLGKIIYGYNGGNQWQMSTLNGGADLQWASSDGITPTIMHVFKQNGDVGFGTGFATPAARLDVKTTAQKVGQFNGGTGMYVSLYENDLYRGYIGSFAGNPEDVDFGTGGSNGTGKVHLTIGAVPKLTVDADGDVGIGTTTPSQKLEINNGFIKVSGTNKTAFVHTAVAGNTSGYITNLSYLNPASTDIVIATHNYSTNNTYLNKSFGVFWTGTTWAIYNEDTVTSILNQSFNVLVIKQ